MPLRILQLNSARLYIGEAAHTLNLTEALRLAGHSVWLGLRRGYLTCRTASERKLDPIPFHLPHRWWPPRDLSDMWRLARLVRRHDIQLIHTHRGKDHWLAALAVQLFKLAVPVIRTRHVVTPTRGHFGNRWLARRTARMIVVSRAVAAEVAAHGLYPPGRVCYIPGGVNLESFVPRGRRQQVRGKLGLGQSVPVAVCVARFAVVKGHRYLLRAWREVRRTLPDAVLLLVGDGALRGEAELLARELGLQDAVQFLGKRKGDEIPELLEAADVGAISSVGSEGFSRAALEYLAMGLPVVASWVGALPDLVDNKVCGRLVPPRDPGALSAALTEVLTAGPEQRAAWGQAGREKAHAFHSYPAWAGAHERLYGEVLEEAGAG
jgi:glycosyltransferase involved in cell wall biosynthesis